MAQGLSSRQVEPAADIPDIVVYLAGDLRSAGKLGFHSPGKIYALARHVGNYGARVLAVNRPVYPILTFLRHHEKWRRWISGVGRLQQLSPNLFVLTPWAPLPDRVVHRTPGASWVNRRILGATVRRALGELRFSHAPIAWFYHPYQLHYVGMAGEQLTVYEICDEYAASARSGTGQLISRLERRMLACADVVFATARCLKETKEQYHRGIHWVPNAADSEHWARVRDPETPVAEAAKMLRHPVVGYLGTVHRHTDIALLKYVAERRPDWTILVVGPEEDRRISRSPLFTALRRLPNVYLVGYVPDVIPYCRLFDVGIIPYRTDSGFNHYVNPLKLHEYTAMGKPVVSTRISEVESHRDLIWIADTPEQFVAAIEEALRTDGPERIAARLERARANSWDARVSEMLTVVRRRLAEPDVALAGSGNHRAGVAAT